MRTKWIRSYQLLNFCFKYLNCFKYKDNVKSKLFLFFLSNLSNNLLNCFKIIKVIFLIYIRGCKESIVNSWITWVKMKRIKLYVCDLGLIIYIAYQFIVRHNWNDIIIIIIKMLNYPKNSFHFLLQKSLNLLTIH